MVLAGIILVFVLLLAASITGIILHVRRAAQREEALGRLAPSLGLTSVAPEELVRGTKPGEAAVWDAAGDACGLVRGNRGQVTNLFHGQVQGRDLWLFDFSYARTPGSHSNLLRTTVVSVAVHAPAASPLPGYFAGRARVDVATVGERLVCHSEAASDGRVPVPDVPSLVGQALEAAARLSAG